MTWDNKVFRVSRRYDGDAGSTWERKMWVLTQGDKGIKHYEQVYEIYIEYLKSNFDTHKCEK